MSAAESTGNIRPPPRRGPHGATTGRDGKRFYSWHGERYWSVTTILSGGVPKPALLPWGIKMVAEGAADLADTLPALVKRDRESAVRMLKGLPWSNRERAADLGTAIHAAVEAHALGQPWPAPSEAEAPFMAQFAEFVRVYEPAWLATEMTVYNRTQRYAGTLDAVVVIDDRTLLLDYKTGKDVYPEVALQLAAYRYAEFAGLPDGSEREMPAVDGAAVLHLTATGHRLVEVRADPVVFTAFLYAREVFRWMEETSKGVIGNPIAAVA